MVTPTFVGGTLHLIDLVVCRISFLLAFLARFLRRFSNSELGICHRLSHITRIPLVVFRVQSSRVSSTSDLHFMMYIFWGA